MKFILIVLGISLIAGQISCDGDWKANKEACAKEAGLPDVKPTGPPDLTDSKVKCFMACMMEKGGVLKDNKLDEVKFVEKIKKFYPDADASFDDKVTECAKKGNALSDKCEVVGVAKTCVEDAFGPPKFKGHKEDESKDE